MKRKPLPIRLWPALLAALASTASLASCAFVGSDMFPAQLQSAAASYNLASAAGQSPAGLSVTKIARLVNSNGVAGVFVLVYQASGYKLFVLSDDLRLEATLGNASFGQFLGTDASGNFVCGSAQISPDFSSVVSSAYTGCFDYSMDIANSAYVIDSAESSGTSIAKYQKTNAEIGTTTLLRSGYYYDLLDSEILAGGTKLYLLARDRSGASALTVLAFPDAENGSSALPTVTTDFYTSSSVSITEVSGDRADQAWLTADGVVSLVQANTTSLVRYAYGSGARLDSQLLDENWTSGVSFETTGNFWYCYDRYKGLLYKMRTWWK